MDRDSQTLILMCRSLNALWSQLARTHPQASRSAVMSAFTDALRRMEAAEQALGKEWMRWFRPRLHRRKSARPFA